MMKKKKGSKAKKDSKKEGDVLNDIKNFDRKKLRKFVYFPLKRKTGGFFQPKEVFGTTKEIDKVEVLDWNEDVVEEKQQKKEPQIQSKINPNDDVKKDYKTHHSSSMETVFSDITKGKDRRHHFNLKHVFVREKKRQKSIAKLYCEMKKYEDMQKLLLKPTRKFSAKRAAISKGKEKGKSFFVKPYVKKNWLSRFGEEFVITGKEMKEKKEVLRKLKENLKTKQKEREQLPKSFFNALEHQKEEEDDDEADGDIDEGLTKEEREELMNFVKKVEEDEAKKEEEVIEEEKEGDDSGDEWSKVEEETWESDDEDMKEIVEIKEKIKDGTFDGNEDDWEDIEDESWDEDENTFFSSPYDDDVVDDVELTEEERKKIKKVFLDDYFFSEDDFFNGDEEEDEVFVVPKVYVYGTYNDPVTDIKPRIRPRKPLMLEYESEEEVEKEETEEKKEKEEKKEELVKIEVNSLDEKVIKYIMMFIDLRSLSDLSLSSKKFHKIFSEDKFWEDYHGSYQYVIDYCRIRIDKELDNNKKRVSIDFEGNPDSNQLQVYTGEILTLIREEGENYYLRNDFDEKGFVPKNFFDPLYTGVSEEVDVMRKNLEKYYDKYCRKLYRSCIFLIRKFMIDEETPRKKDVENFKKFNIPFPPSKKDFVDGFYEPVTKKKNRECTIKDIMEEIREFKRKEMLKKMILRKKKEERKKNEKVKLEPVSFCFDIDEIPDEMVIHIMMFLPLKDLLMFSLCTKRFYYLSNYKSFWKDKVEMRGRIIKYGNYIRQNATGIEQEGTLSVVMFDFEATDDEELDCKEGYVPTSYIELGDEKETLNKWKHLMAEFENVVKLRDHRQTFFYIQQFIAPNCPDYKEVCDVCMYIEKGDIPVAPPMGKLKKKGESVDLDPGKLDDDEKNDLMKLLKESLYKKYDDIEQQYSEPEPESDAGWSDGEEDDW